MLVWLQSEAHPWRDEAVLMWMRYARRAAARGALIETPAPAGPWKQARHVLGQRELAEATGRTRAAIRALHEGNEWVDPYEDDAKELAQVSPKSRPLLARIAIEKMLQRWIAAPSQRPTFAQVSPNLRPTFALARVSLHQHQHQHQHQTL